MYNGEDQDKIALDVKVSVRHVDPLKVRVKQGKAVRGG